jgi:cytoplasmic iron level regulating protein YaaA (DUF328/UPF0246 family)
MLTILLHSSKTMRTPNASRVASSQKPALLSDADILADYLKSLTPADLQKMMKFSEAMATKTQALIASYQPASSLPMTAPAIDSFLGDIYSGLQVQAFTEQDRNYANQHLYILSGLYGVIRALDEIQPYRLEMGYTLNSTSLGKTLYEFWGDRIAALIPKKQTILNLAAHEYTKAVLPYLKNVPVISPKFLTISPKTSQPTFVTVHAKIARGAFARWLIQHKISSPNDIQKFDELGYRYDETLSTYDVPVFVAREFQGIGLSVRLT